MRLAIATGVVVEEMGTDLLVMVPSSSKVLKLTGESAEVVRAVRSGLTVVPGKVVDDLRAVGVLEGSSLTRRGLVTGGVIGLGAGIAVLAMPGVAAADSTRIKLVGEWYFDADWSHNDNKYFFYVYKENNPSFPAFIDAQLYDPANRPGLTVDSTAVANFNWLTPDLDWVGWSGALASRPAAGTVLVGTFEYGGLRYEAQFSEVPDPT